MTENKDEWPDYAVWHRHELENALEELDETKHPEQAAYIRRLIETGGYRYDPDPVDRRPPLRFLGILAGAVYVINRHRLPLLRVLAVPLSVYTAVTLLYYATGWDSPGVAFLYILVYYAMQIVVAVSTHRIVLLGPDSMPRWGILKPARRELWFALYLMAIGFLAGLTSLAVLVPVAGTLLAIVLWAYFSGRLSLVFPAVAVDRPIDLGESWRLTEPYVFTMALVVLVAPFLFALPAWAFYFIPGVRHLSFLIELVGVVFAVACLSLVYVEICKREYGETAIEWIDTGKH